MKRLIAAALMSFGLAGPALADEAKDRADVLAVVDRFFVAMTKHDAQAWVELSLPDTPTTVQSFQADGTVKLRRSTVQAMAANLGSGQQMNERIWKPTVLVRGPMAMVWAPYEFKLDGQQHHCGIDVFHLMQVDGAWKLSAVSWTQEPSACAELGA